MLECSSVWWDLYCGKSEWAFSWSISSARGSPVRGGTSMAAPEAGRGFSHCRTHLRSRHNGHQKPMGLFYTLRAGPLPHLPFRTPSKLSSSTSSSSELELWFTPEDWGEPKPRGEPPLSPPLPGIQTWAAWLAAFSLLPLWEEDVHLLLTGKRTQHWGSAQSPRRPKAYFWLRRFVLSDFR